MKYKQTTFKKFVIPIMLILTLNSSVLPSRADQDDFSRFLLKISLKKTFPEALSMKEGNKSADWFINKSKKDKPREIEKKINKTLLEHSQGLVRKLHPQGVKLAIDITKIPVYSKSKSKFITKGEAEKGTTKFYQFLGFSIAERQLKFPITSYLLEKDDIKIMHEILRRYLIEIKNKIKTSLILLDRGFISSKIVQTLYSLNYSFIIAYRKSKKFIRVFKALEHPKTMNKDVFYVPNIKAKIYRLNRQCWLIKDFKYGNPSVKVNLVIWKIKKNKSKKKLKSELINEYFLYITSPDVSPEKVYDYYGKRWRIETSFRQIKHIQAKTRVINPIHRIWLFAVACLIYASWIYRHLPRKSEDIFPEDLASKELEKLYKDWKHARLPLRELVDQYLGIINSTKSLFFTKEG